MSRVPQNLCFLRHPPEASNLTPNGVRSATSEVACPGWSCLVRGPTSSPGAVYQRLSIYAGSLRVEWSTARPTHIGFGCRRPGSPIARYHGLWWRSSIRPACAGAARSFVDQLLEEPVRVPSMRDARKRPVLTRQADPRMLEDPHQEARRPRSETERLNVSREPCLAFSDGHFLAFLLLVSTRRTFSIRIRKR